MVIRIFDDGLNTILLNIKRTRTSFFRISNELESAHLLTIELKHHIFGFEWTNINLNDKLNWLEHQTNSNLLMDLLSNSNYQFLASNEQTSNFEHSLTLHYRFETLYPKLLLEKLFNLFCNWPYMLCKYLITRFRELSLLGVKGEELPLVAERKLQKSFKFAFPLLTGLSTKLLKNMIAHYLDKLFLLFLLLLLFI